jgi:hypothetical protein
MPRQARCIYVADTRCEAAEAASTVMQMDEVPQCVANRRISALVGSLEARRATTLVTRGSCPSERFESSSQA